MNNITPEKNIELPTVPSSLFDIIDDIIDDDFLGSFMITILDNYLDEIKLENDKLFGSIHQLFESNKIDMNEKNDIYYFFLALYYYYIDETLTYITKNALVYNYLKMAIEKNNYIAIIFYALVFQCDEPDKQDRLIHSLLDDISKDNKGYLLYQLGKYYYNFDKERGLFYYNYIVENEIKLEEYTLKVIGDRFYKEKQYENMKYCYIKVIEQKNDLRAVLCSACSLGRFYYEQKDYENMKKYWNILVNFVESDDDIKSEFIEYVVVGNAIVEGLSKFGKYYQHIEKNYDEMKRCYNIMMNEYSLNYITIDDSKNIDSIYSDMLFHYGKYYQYVEKDYNKMKKFYEEAIENENKDAMKQLGEYYIDTSISMEEDENENKNVSSTSIKNNKNKYHYTYLLFINLFLLFNVLFKCFTIQ